MPPDSGTLEVLQRRIQQQIAKLPKTFQIDDAAKAAWEVWYKRLPDSEHCKRLDTMGYPLLALIALTTDKDRIDLDTVLTVWPILDYELNIRATHGPH